MQVLRNVKAVKYSDWQRIGGGQQGQYEGEGRGQIQHMYTEQRVSIRATGVEQFYQPERKLVWSGHSAGKIILPYATGGRGALKWMHLV